MKLNMVILYKAEAPLGSLSLTYLVFLDLTDLQKTTALEIQVTKAKTLRSTDAMISYKLKCILILFC